MWTTSYTVPNDLRNSEKAKSFASAINIGSDIWIFCSHKQPQQPFSTEIWVFNIETCEYRKINFKASKHFGHYFVAIKKVDDHIYVWRSRERRRNCDINMECAVIGKRMYALEYQGDMTNGVIYMHKINLDTKRVEPKRLLKNATFDSEFQLMTNNDELYLSEYVSENNRNVYRIINGQLTIVCENQWNRRENELEDILKSLECNNNAYLQHIHATGEVVYRNTFDFESRKWTRQLSIPPFVYPYVLGIRDSFEINDNIYMLIDRSYKKEVGYDIRVFETKLRLESICLMEVVEEYLRNKDFDMVERVKQSLPSTMRTKLEDMLFWRVLEALENEDMDDLLEEMDMDES